MSRRNRRASRRGGNYNNDKRNGGDDEQEIIRIHNEEENNFGGNIVHVVFLILPVHKTKCAVGAMVQELILVIILSVQGRRIMVTNLQPLSTWSSRGARKTSKHLQEIYHEATGQNSFSSRIIKVSIYLESLINNRMGTDSLKNGTFKVGSKGWDWSMGSIQDP